MNPKRRFDCVMVRTLTNPRHGNSIQTSRTVSVLASTQPQAEKLIKTQYEVNGWKYLSIQCIT